MVDLNEYTSAIVGNIWPKTTFVFEGYLNILQSYIYTSIYSSIYIL